MDLDADDLHERQGATCVCAGMTAFHWQLQGSCLGSLFGGDTVGIDHHCPVMQNKAKWAAEGLSPDTVALYFRSPTRVQISCTNGTLTTATMAGMSQFHLPASCSLVTGDMQVTTTGDIIGRATVLQQPDWTLPALLHNQTPRQILNARAHLEALNISAPEDIRLLMQEENRALERDELRRRDLEHDGLGKTAVIAISTLAALVTVGAVVCACNAIRWISNRRRRTDAQ
jgi:hypothetical protein